MTKDIMSMVGDAMACKYQIGETVQVGRFHGIITGYTRDTKGRARCKYTCCVCGYHGEKLEYLIAKGSGCRACSGLEIVIGYNDIPTTAPWMVQYFQGGIEEAQQYTNNSTKKLYFKCPDCGRIATKPLSINNLYHKRRVTCLCRDAISIPNKFIWAITEHLFESNQIKKYIREHRLMGGGQRKYDMYMVMPDDKEIIVEMDGGLGHGHIQRYADTILNPEETLRIDNEKDELAKKLGIEIIRIDATNSNYDYLRDRIIQSELSNIFDLTNINWNEVYEKCSSNILKEVCKYKKEHPDAFTTDAAKIFQLSRSTIADYWKRGSQLGWCEYTGGKDEPIRKNRGGNFNNRYCPLKVITPTKETHIYLSILELQRESKDKYGFIMWNNITRSVCRGEKSDYKGYKIEIIDKETREWQDLKQEKQSEKKFMQKLEFQERRVQEKHTELY